MFPVRRHVLFWGVLGLALAVGAGATIDRYQRIDRIFAGFSVMETPLVAAGGAERGAMEPFDLVRAVNGQLVQSGRDIQQTIESQDPGTTFRYIVYRRGALAEVDVASRLYTRRDFARFVGEGLVPGLLHLVLGAVVFLLKPGWTPSWVFLGFSLITYVVSVTYADAHTTYRFGALFLTAWAFWPATLTHLALTFPQRRRLVRRYPRVVWAPYVASTVSAILLQARFASPDVVRLGVVLAAGSAYWGFSLVLLVLSLARASLAGITPLMRQRARVLFAAFSLGYVPPVLGTVVEAMFRVPVPYLNEAWRLVLLFPAVMAYAMVRYDLFDVRAALRAGTIYSVATGLVVLAYAGAIVLLDLVFTRELAASPIVAAAIVAFVVVVLLNPLLVRTQRVVDRLFFRARIDVERSIERVSEVMAGLLDLRRIAALLTQTVAEQLQPVRQALYLIDGARDVYAPPREAGNEEGEEERAVPVGGALPWCLERIRQPLSRDRVEEDPVLQDRRDDALAEMDALGATLVAPIRFQDRLTGFLALGPRRSGMGYSTQDVGLVRLLASSSALALEHARAYATLEATNAELAAALRRVEILESVRRNLAKFVPRTVQDLIDRAPEAPELDKREVDVSVLFVDLVGYTRLTERLDPARVNALVERYFGAYLDEILRRGGDVNETAGDGLMAIFRDANPRRHARQAVKAALGVLRRTRELNAAQTALPEPVGVHVGVNSGTATVGTTKIESAAGTRWTYTASGQVTNVAARLAALGQVDEAMVGAETHGRLGGEFPFEALGERALRNVEIPVSVYRLTLPTGVPVET
jgi:class 3 adenylate cyclase